MPADNTFTEAKLREALAKLGKIPPAPQIFWTHLLTGNKAYTRGDRNYISLEALSEFKCAPVNPFTQGMPAFGAVDILNAEDVARPALGYPGDGPMIEKARKVCADLLAIASAEYGDKAGAALQCAFYRPPEKEEDTQP